VSILIDSNSDQQTFGTNTPILTNLQVDGIGHEERISLVQRAFSEGFHNRIQTLAQAGDHGFRKAFPAKFFGDQFDFPCGNTVDDHLDHGQDKCLLASLIALEHRCAEVTVSVSRNAQRDRSDPGRQISIPEAISIGCTVFSAFIGGST
jgi:hypothetical protein